MKIRRAAPEDAAEIARIYNHYVEHTHHTFETEPVRATEMGRRISRITENYPFLVFEENGRIDGYAYAARYKERDGYRHSVEISVYVRPGAHRKGIGKTLYRKLFEELSAMDVHAIIAGIALPNEASIRLHENFGLEKVAHFREVGRKLGRWIDVGYWEKVSGER